MYFLFAGNHYYPSGGMNDFEGSYATLAQAIATGKKMLEEHGQDWYNVSCFSHADQTLVIMASEVKK